MQPAKDTFYEVLCARLATLNPERTVAVRGVLRPGVLVDENEVMASAALPDCFHLRWTSCAIETAGVMPSVALTCEVSYATAGTVIGGGLDRGRALEAMDGELLAAVRQCPQNIVKSDYSALADGGLATVLGTRVWWGDVALEPVKVERDRVTRTATIAVMSYQEAGEL